MQTSTIILYIASSIQSASDTLSCYHPSSLFKREMQLKDAVDYPTIFNSDTRIGRGLCTVTANKLNPIESHQLYYELHGSTDKDAEKIIFIMGLVG